jgi:hypothetical protein
MMHRLEPHHFSMRSALTAGLCLASPKRRSGPNAPKRIYHWTSMGAVANLLPLQLTRIQQLTRARTEPQAHKRPLHTAGTCRPLLALHPPHANARTRARAAGGAPPAKQRCWHPARRPRMRWAPRSSAARAAGARSGIVVKARLLLTLHLNNALVEVLMVYLRRPRTQGTS